MSFSPLFDRVFEVKRLQAFEYDYTREKGDKSKTYTVSEFPYVGYLRRLRTTDHLGDEYDENQYIVKFDLEVTDMGQEILARNPAKARQWVEDRYDRYPDGFNPSDVNDLKQQLELITDGDVHGAVDLTTTNGEMVINGTETTTIRGHDRVIVTTTITTTGRLEVQIDNTAKLIIDITHLP